MIRSNGLTSTAIGDEYSYWDSGKLRQRTMTRVAGSRRSEDYDKRGNAHHVTAGAGPAIDVLVVADWAEVIDGKLYLMGRRFHRPRG
jgi:hypothetical protein